MKNIAWQTVLGAAAAEVVRNSAAEALREIGVEPAPTV